MQPKIIALNVSDIPTLSHYSHFDQKLLLFVFFAYIINFSIAILQYWGLCLAVSIYEHLPCLCRMVRRDDDEQIVSLLGNGGRRSPREYNEHQVCLDYSK